MECLDQTSLVPTGRCTQLGGAPYYGTYVGYHFDSFAITEFEKLAEQVLADHKELLRDGPNALHFAEILDVFVSAGWPRAMQIVTLLDKAIR